MNRKSVIGASALVVATMLGTGVAVGASLPADVVLPIHWGLDGRPDGFSDKWTALLLPAAITSCLSLLFYFVPALEPRREGLERSQGLYLWGWVALLLMGAIIQLAVVAVALGWPLDAGRLIVAGTGAMLVLIGNQLGKSRSMYLIGMRTPWTLASEDVWIRTHRLAGKLMVAAGLVIAGAALLDLAPEWRMALLIAVIALSAGVPFVYSFLLWRRERVAQSSE
ncbi:MAG TPA: SdpI family protein [Allosphingosinicella sp.]|nr:SdpI family protein [Allosphingosinicella sp.]